MAPTAGIKDSWAGESDEETAHELWAGDATLSGVLLRCTEETIYDCPSAILVLGKLGKSLPRYVDV